MRMGLERSQSADISSWCQAEEFCPFPSFCWMWGRCRDVAFSKGQMGRVGWDLMCWPLTWPFWAVKKNDQFRTIRKSHHMGLVVIIPQWPASALFAICGNHQTDELCKASWIPGSSNVLPPFLVFSPHYQWTQHFLHSQESRAQSQRGNSSFHPLFPPSSLPINHSLKRWLSLSTAGWYWHCQYWIWI